MGMLRQRESARAGLGALGLGPALAALAVLAMLAGGCRCEADADRLGVWAPASLVDVLPEVTAAFRGPDDPPVTFSFDATSRIARQVLDGAPANLFLSADERWMDRVEQAGAIEPETRTQVLGNALVVITPGDRPRGWASLDELARSDLERIVLGGEAVPVGRYAEQALRNAGLWQRLAPRVVRADHARAVLAWVARGEVDAGLVYRTDARSTPGVRVAFEVPSRLHPPIVYSAAVVRRSSHPKRARALLSFLRTDEAGRIFERAGFRVLEGSP